MTAATTLARVAGAARAAARRASATAPSSRKRSLAFASILFLIALIAATSLRTLVSRESDAAAHARERDDDHAAYNQQQQQQILDAERAALGAAKAARPIAVDPSALLAACACGDRALAALAADLERATTTTRHPWPLAVARAQMRAALDLASAGAMAVAAAQEAREGAEGALAVDARFAAAEAALQRAGREKGTARRRRRAGARVQAQGRPSPPSLPRPTAATATAKAMTMTTPAHYRRLAREHRRGWALAQRLARLLAERAAEAAGSPAPIPCGGSGGDATLPGLGPGATALLVVTMAADSGGGGGGRGGPSAAAAAAASSSSSARNAAWQAVRLAAGTPHGRLAVSVAVLLERAEGGGGVEKKKKAAAKRGGGGGATAAAEAAARAQAAERAGHLRASAALLRLALAPLGVECRAAELTPPPPRLPTATAAPGARNATAAQRVAAMAAALEVGPGPASGQPQPPFVGPGAALARNAAVDAFFFFSPPSSSSSTSSQPFTPDAVLFADARAFFCAEDALRLLSYPASAHAGVDLACALPLVEDPWPEGGGGGGGGGDSGSSSLLSPVSLFAEQPQQGADADAALAAADAARAHPDVPSRLRLRSLRADTAADAARDVRGSALAPLPPFLVHADSAALARQGQPVPVRCCWGGLARVAAWPFRRGVRFRVGGGGAGGSSCARPYHEASVLCEDLHRLSLGGAVLGEEDGGGATASASAAAAAAAAASGRRGPARALLDPAARTSPQARVRRALAHRRFPYYYYTRMEVGTWRADVEPLMRKAAAAAGGGGAGGGEAPSGGEGMVFWPPPGRPAGMGGMWQPIMRRVACCEVPFGGGGAGWGGSDGVLQQRPSLAGTDCRAVVVRGGGGGIGGRNETRAFFDACSSSKKGRDDDAVRMFCPGGG